MKVAAFFPARNEEKVVEKTIKSLLDQTVVVDPIVLVDDGSQDRTAKIGENLDCVVLKLPYHEESWVGTSKLAIPCNAGLAYIRDNVRSLELILQMGADHVLSPDYVEIIGNRMEEDPLIKVASGALSTTDIAYMPHGSGRVVDAAFWKEISNMTYPVIPGWESWLLYKTWSMGFKTRNYVDILSEARKGRMYPKKARGWGKSMYSVGASPVYTFLRAGKLSIKSPQNGIAMLLGYLESFFTKPLRAEPEVREYLRKVQMQNLLSKIGLAEKVNHL